MEKSYSERFDKLPNMESHMGPGGKSKPVKEKPKAKKTGRYSPEGERKRKLVPASQKSSSFPPPKERKTSPKFLY